MRKSIITALGLMLMFSCGKKLSDVVVIRKTVPYEYDADIPNVPNPGTPPPAQGLTVPFPKFTVVTNSTAFFNENNTSAEKLTSAKASALSMTLTQPTNSYLDYIDTLRVYISADNVPEVLAAYKYGSVGQQKTIDLTCKDAELRNYFIKDSMYFRIEAHFTDYPDSNSSVHLKTMIDVVANPLR